MSFPDERTQTQTLSRARVALVTGAARGIGRSIALRLAADGNDVAVNDIPGNAALEDVVKEILALGRRTYAIYASVTEEAQVEAMVAEVVEQLGGLDIMVANAGIAKTGSILDVKVEDYDELMAINVRGVMLCYKHAAKQMVAQGRGGRIIGASSFAGKKGVPSLLIYSASKYAVRGLTQSAAAELAKYGITVNAYAPGVIDTPMLSAWVPGSGSAAKAATVERFKILVGRVGEPDDVAHVVSFLADERASFVTGQTVSVNGGTLFD